MMFAGTYDTAFLASQFHGVDPAPAGPDEEAAAVLAALFAHVESSAPRVPARAESESRWRAGAPLRMTPRGRARP